MPDWKESISENLRSAPELSDVQDLNGLATGFITAKKGLTNWKDGLPDELKKDPGLESIKDIPGLAKSFVHAQRMIGKDKIVMPGENAKPEEWGEFFKKLGRPDKPEDYKLARPSDLPKDFPFDDKLIQAYGTTAHELGLTPKQAMGLYKWFMTSETDAFSGMAKDAEKSRNDAETVLRKEFGGAYEERLEAANKMLSQFGNPELAEFLKSSPAFGNSPHLVKFLANVAGQFSEDTLKGMGERRFSTRTPAEAQEEIRQLRSDDKFWAAYTDAKHVGHEDAVSKMKALYESANPEKEK